MAFAEPARGMSAAATFPERFADVKATFVPPLLPEKYRRPLLALPPQDKLSPALIAAINAVGGRDECSRRLEAWSKHREEHFLAMVDEPVGSPFRTVHGAELLTSSGAPVLLVHCHIAQVRIFRATVRDIIGGPLTAFFRPGPESSASKEASWRRRSPEDFIDPTGLMAGVRGLAALRNRRDGAMLSYTPDARTSGMPAGGRIDTTFLGLRWRISSFLPLAVRATSCRLVFGVGEMRWPIEDGMDFRFFEPVSRDELLGLDDKRLLRRVLEECEKMIYANIWTWSHWEFFGMET